MHSEARSKEEKKLPHEVMNNRWEIDLKDKIPLLDWEDAISAKLTGKA